MDDKRFAEGWGQSIKSVMLTLIFIVVVQFWVDVPPPRRAFCEIELHQTYDGL